MHSSYIIEPPNAKCAVLMIHGICSTPRHFDFLVSEFDENWAIYNILLDGHGGTVQDFSHTSMKRWKAQTKEMLDRLSERYDHILILGYSMGTLLSLWALPNYPKVLGLLLLNPPMRPWVRFSMLKRSRRFTKGIVRQEDPHEVACLRDIGVTLSSGIWQYLGWIPRFLELLRLCRYCRQKACIGTVPTYVHLGRRDELVSLRSQKYFADHPQITVRIADEAGHFYFPEKDVEAVRADLRALIKIVKFAKGETHGV